MLRFTPSILLDVVYFGFRLRLRRSFFYLLMLYSRTRKIVMYSKTIVVFSASSRFVSRSAVRACVCALQPSTKVRQRPLCV